MLSARFWAALVLAAALIGASGQVAAAEAGAAAAASDASAGSVGWTEGTHYSRLPVPVRTRSGDKVEVVEVFSYMCIHCFNFDSTLHEWVAGADPDSVQFRRVPAVFNQMWALFAQAYFTAEALGVTEQVHTPLFEAVHRYGQDLRDPEQMAALFERAASVSKKDFDALYNSFSVRSRVEQAVADGRAYRITGVPSLVVNGKYLVDGNMAGNNTNMLKVVDHLVALEKSGAE